MKSKKMESKPREVALHYMTTLSDVAHESFVILDAKLRVIFANPIFYETFQVKKQATENVLLYNLGNRQWNIPELKKLLEEILPKKKVVRNYAVSHIFEKIGLKTIELNARQIDSVQLIIIAMEDVSVRKNLEKKLEETVKTLEKKVYERTSQLEDRIKDLERMNRVMVGREMKMIELKKQIKKLQKKK